MSDDNRARDCLADLLGRPPREPAPPRQPAAGAPAEPEPDVTFTLRPMADAVPVHHRLKQLLKVALRRFRFRLVALRDAHGAGPDGAQHAPGGQAGPEAVGADRRAPATA
jgi:hypothetical protein